MMAGIFISYRRDESRHAAGRLADDLVEAFGADSIFRDIEGIEPGVDFTQALDKALGACVVMLVVIGPRWLAMADAAGGRRLDQPGDWIRMEIATALRRQTRVIPVLLEGAELPRETDLPEDIRPLVRRQAFELADGRWHGDIQRLISALAKVPGLALREPVGQPGPAPRSRQGRSWLWWPAGLAALLLAGVFIDGLDGGDYLPVEEARVDPQPIPQYQPQAEPVPAAASLQREEPASATLPDISGLWRSDSGEVYDVDQNGSEIEFYSEIGGQPLGMGRGRLDGQMLRVTMTVYTYGVASGIANCDLQAAADGRSYSGMCSGTNGVFPARIYR
jgi:hypothetical protein